MRPETCRSSTSGGWPACWTCSKFTPRLAKKAGIEKRVHPHGLRHTYAYELAVAEGKPAPLIQAALGHSSLATTDRYLRHIAPAELIETMRSREWSL